MNGQIGAASAIATKHGSDVSHVDDIDRGLEELRSGKGADMIMIDVKLSIGSLIDKLVSERITIPVVACGIAADAKSAVRAIKAGAKEYIPLPPDAELIGAILSAISEESHTLIYKDQSMKDMLKIADQVAPSEASILITGESGTGKEVIARYIHRKSSRKNSRFVAVNCAAIPENLLESELFGHEKGAFTGAVARKLGKFEEANDGTLLLDEISEMDIRLQAKLLRALQEKEIDRIGGKKPVKINTRILATSNRDLVEEVKSGRFREDLFFRLNVINLDIPPLCKRKDDIKPLAEHFIHKYSEENDISEKPLSKEAEENLFTHPWNGNVRELENAMHRAVLLSTGDEISPEAVMLSKNISGIDDTDAANENIGDFIGRTVASVERDLIIDTLKHCIGNRTHAATILGISIRTLRNKLNLYSKEGFQVPLPGTVEK